MHNTQEAAGQAERLRRSYTMHFRVKLYVYRETQNILASTQYSKCNNVKNAEKL